MAYFDTPTNSPIIDDSKMGTAPWITWFARVQSVISAAQQSGTTAQRPTTGLWIGRQYYDKTLNKPVYVNSVQPTVWKDAAGTTV